MPSGRVAGTHCAALPDAFAAAASCAFCRLSRRISSNMFSSRILFLSLQLISFLARKACGNERAQSSTLHSAFRRSTRASACAVWICSGRSGGALPPTIAAPNCAPRPRPRRPRPTPGCLVPPFPAALALALAAARSWPAVQLQPVNSRTDTFSARVCVRTISSQRTSTLPSPARNALVHWESGRHSFATTHSATTDVSISSPRRRIARST